MSEEKQNTITFNSSELEQMQPLIPEGRFKEFLKRIEVALEIYQELDEQKLNWLEIHGDKILKQTMKELHTFIN